MDNQSNPPPPDLPFPDVPVITHDISSYSREERKRLRFQLKNELHRVRALIETVKIKEAKIKTPKIKAVKIKNFKIEAGSLDQNASPKKLINEYEEMFKKLRKY
ncbi:Hypothetical predicted protein [Olea europaea subsp. europaea]|uniref:Uncharacterized protein n=1 Tax=Olea europaea subsp. europaea TaxID=158383 RepID=A0A8S0T8P5_OLEEU|nr:Hypothetical predicted protein [Olea europaea subsp. europaea]